MLSELLPRERTESPDTSSGPSPRLGCLEDSSSFEAIASFGRRSGLQSWLPLERRGRRNISHILPLAFGECVFLYQWHLGGGGGGRLGCTQDIYGDQFPKVVGVEDAGGSSGTRT